MRASLAIAGLIALCGCGGVTAPSHRAGQHDAAFAPDDPDAGAAAEAPADAGASDAGAPASDAGVADAGAPDGGPAGPTLAGCPMFPPDNPWNRDISGEPADPHSAGAQDPRWPLLDLEQLKSVPASAFEVVQLPPLRPGL
jgi:hypothetical protein